MNTRRLALALAASLGLATSLAYASAPGNEGPGAAPVLPTLTTIASFEVRIFFAPPSMAGVRGVKVLSDGEVIGFVHTGGTQKDQLVTMLSAATLAGLEQRISKVQAGELYDPKAGGPVCADAPTSSYEVVRGSEKIEIARTEGCHSLYLKDGSGEQLQRVLDGLYQLGQLGL
jgi:hypothetical protein